jgi:type III pantothenate kinase
MMVLLLDSGNSRLKVALLARDASGAWRYTAPPAALAHDTVATALPAWLAEQLDAAARARGGADTARLPDGASGPVHRALGVNVAGPDAARRITEALASFGVPHVAWQLPGAQTLGLRNGYRTPTQLGADRWMGLVGIWTSAQAATAAPRQLVNFGTATTIDTISPDGKFVGGLIVPGWNLMRDALAQRTAQLPTAAGGVLGFPTETHDAITSGIAAAQAGAVLRQWLVARARFGIDPVLHITGGASAEVLAEIQQVLAHAGVSASLQQVPHPVIDGLRAVFLAGDAPAADASPQHAPSASR